MTCSIIMLQKSSAQKVFYAEKSLAINRSSPLGEIRRLENFAIKRRLKQARRVEYQSLPACGVFFEKSFRVPKVVPKRVSPLGLISWVSIRTRRAREVYD